MSGSRVHWFILILVAIALAGCASGTYFITTPNVDVGERGEKVFATVPETRRAPDMEIFFAADRAVQRQTILGPVYGYGRSGYLAFGRTVVGFDPDMTWDELVEESTSRDRSGKSKLTIRVSEEYGRLAIPIDDMEVRDGRYRLTASAAEQLDAARQRLHEVLHDRLGKADRRDVYLFVHGFNNSFEDAVFRLAQVWHFMGRPGIAMAYTWPAGRGGLFGYAYDRESGDFTVFHLKKLLVAIAGCEDVERVHIIAHSRGTDVAVTALRELNIEYKAKGLDTQKQLKLQNLVLAAPDLDADVFEQRFGIEDLHAATARTTVYLSKQDLALELSNWLFGGKRRLGNLSAEDFSEDARTKLFQLENFNMVSCDVTGHSTSHDYAFVHPAVLSDLILVLRDNRAPGAANGRPLESPWEGIWRIQNDYLLEPADAQDSPRSPTTGGGE